MSAAATTIPIQHCQIIHEVETTREPESRAQELTLLELVEAVGEVTADEQEIVATVTHLLVSGRVRLIGNFHDEPVDEILRSS